MPFGLAGDGGRDRGVKWAIVLAGAERAAQIGGIVLAETHIKRAGAGDADAIAGLA
jgi:hypothetical protein